jgi:hypothetical protein
MSVHLDQPFLPRERSSSGILRPGLGADFGVTQNYQANTDSPVFSDLRGLPFKTPGLVDVLAQAL